MDIRVRLTKVHSGWKVRACENEGRSWTARRRTHPQLQSGSPTWTGPLRTFQARATPEGRCSTATAKRRVKCRYSSISMNSRMRCVNSPTLFLNSHKIVFAPRNHSLLSQPRLSSECVEVPLALFDQHFERGQLVFIRLYHQGLPLCSVGALVTPQRALELLLSLITVKSKLARGQVNLRN
jgi:hypothetical protein